MKKILFLLLLVLGYVDAFSQVTTDLRCNTIGLPNGSQTQYNEIGYWLNNSPIEYSGCSANPAIIVSVIDSYCNPWSTCTNNFGQYNVFNSVQGNCSSGSGNCRNRPENYFIFQLNDPNQLVAMVNFLNTIPTDDYILAYTWYTYAYSTIPSFSAAFQSLGATMINGLADNVPYIFFMKKGNPLSIMELTGQSATDTLTLYASFSCMVSSVPEINAGNFSVYPNPARDVLQFKVDRGGYKLKIYDLAGRLVIEKEAEDGMNKVDVSNLSNGSYQLYLSSDQENKRTVFQIR